MWRFQPDPDSCPWRTRADDVPADDRAVFVAVGKGLEQPFVLQFGADVLDGLDRESGLSGHARIKGVGLLCAVRLEDVEDDLARTGTLRQFAGRGRLQQSLDGLARLTEVDGASYRLLEPLDGNSLDPER